MNLEWKPIDEWPGPTAEDCERGQTGCYLLHFDLGTRATFGVGYFEMHHFGVGEWVILSAEGFLECAVPPNVTHWIGPIPDAPQGREIVDPHSERNRGRFD